jgi:hypothetical protein
MPLAEVTAAFLDRRDENEPSTFRKNIRRIKFMIEFAGRGTRTYLSRL